MSTSQGVIDASTDPLTSTDESQIVKLRFTLLRASDLPDSRLRLCKYFVTLKTSAGWADGTDRRKGKNPEWNKEFLCDVNATSPNLSIDVFRIGLTGNVKLVAIAFLDVATCLDPSSTDILDNASPLLSPIDHTPLDKATIFYSYSLYHDGRPPVELTPRPLQELVQGEVAIPKTTTPGNPGLATASSPITRDITHGIDRLGQITTDASTLRLWDSEKGEAVVCLEGHRDGVTSIVFSPDRMKIESGPWDNECRDNHTRTDCMEDMIVRFSGREIPEGLSLANRRKFIDSILNDPKVRHRFVFRQWPLLVIPSHPVSKEIKCKSAPNRIGWWGSTLFDFFSVQLEQTAGLEDNRSFTTGSRLLNGEYGGVNAMAKDCIAWAEKEKDPELVAVYNIAKLIKSLENLALSNKADEKEGRMQEDTDFDTKKKHDELLTPQAPQLLPLKSVFDSAAYPGPWTGVVPFSKSGPWCYDTLPVLEEYIPQSRLPQELIVHDPWNLLFATNNRCINNTPWNEQVRANPDSIHTYTRRSSHGPVLSKRRDDDEKILAQEEVDHKRILDNFLANPHSSTPRPFGLEIRGSYSELNVPTKPAIYVILPPRPPLAAASEAHLYLSPMHYAGAGNHSFVYHAEWELPRSCLVEEQICIHCVMEDVDAIVREQDGENGQTRDGKWDQLSGKMVLKTVNTPPITVVMTTEGGLDGTKEYVLSEEENSREVVYEGPYRVVHSQVKYQNLARAPYCEHLRKLPSSVHPFTSKVRVVAKLSIKYDNHLDKEAKNYQRFPKHFFEHWSGYNLLPPLDGPIPIGAVVPQFYGYYAPKEVKTGRYLSPILLLEYCGETFYPGELTFDDKQECASFGLKLHLNNWLHGSFHRRNILRKPGPLRIHPDKRVDNTKKRDRYGVDWSYRLVDFGRSADVDDRLDLLYNEHMSVRSWAAGTKELD